MTSMLVTPERSLDQRMSALEEANRIRMHRARLKRDIAARRKHWHAGLVDPRCSTMKVFDLLLTVPKYGRVKVNRVLMSCQISPSKTIGGLSERQVGALLELVR